MQVIFSFVCVICFIIIILKALIPLLPTLHQSLFFTQRSSSRILAQGKGDELEWEQTGTQPSIPKPKKCDHVSYHPFKSHHTSGFFLFLRSWKRCWHNVMSGSEAVHKDPPRTLGIITPMDRLDSQLWSEAKAKLKPLGREWPQVWRFMEQVTLAVRTRDHHHLSKKMPSAIVRGNFSADPFAQALLGSRHRTPAGAWGSLSALVCSDFSTFSPSLSFHLVVYLFTQRALTEHLQCVRHCSKHWPLVREQDIALF